MVYRSIIRLEKPQTHKSLKVKRTSSREKRSGTSLLKQGDPQVERFRAGIFVRFEEMSERWAVFHSCSLFSTTRSRCYRIGESAYTPYTVRKKGAEKLLRNPHKTFSYSTPFFSACSRCKG